MMGTDKTIAGIRVSALIEIAVFLVVALLLDAAAFDGNRYWGVEPHPFWIIILAAAVQYGTNEALVAAILASIVLLLGNMPPQPDGMDWYTYIYYAALNPLLWVVTAVILGEVRQRHIRQRQKIEKELDESRDREDTIAESYRVVKARKENLEVQVAGQLTSSVEAYRAAKAVESLDPKAVLQGIENLVQAILGPQKFSVFMLDENNKLSANIIHGWDDTDGYAREIDSFSPLYKSVISQQHVLCVANEDQEGLLDAQGILAGPVIDPDSGNVVGMLKIEQMSFVSLSLNTVETFRALCEWVGTAMVNARYYQTVKDESVVNPENNLMTFNFFRRQSEYLRSLAKRVGFDLSLLVIKLNNANTLDSEAEMRVARQLSASVQKVLRSVDLAFDYQTDGEEYSVLLPATSQQGANIVRDKISKDLADNLRNLPDDVNFSFIVQSLHEAA
ncbi:MAG: hypothetical protein CMM94_07925 [Rickettsiales bacterium]|nr:hypothetical protein [Rickettsiales bacterium]